MEVRFLDPILAILLRFGQFCLNLGRIAWIWAIWLILGQIRPQRRQSPEDGAGGDGQTDLQTDRFPVFYRTSFSLGPLLKSRSPY